MLHEVRNGKYDGILGAFYTQERSKDFRYTLPIYEEVTALIALKKSGLISYSTLRDLEGYRIGVFSDWAYSPEFDNADFLSKDKSTKFDLLRLQQGRVDILAITIPMMSYLIQQDKLDADQFVILKPYLASQLAHIAFSRKVSLTGNYVEAFNRGLVGMVKDGSYLALFQNHGQRGEIPKALSEFSQ